MIPKSTLDLITDGMTTALGGVDTNTHPSIIQPNQISYGLNVSLRGSFPSTRPRFIKRTLTFASAEAQAWFVTHKLQGADLYRAKNTDETSQIVSVAGRLFKVDASFNVTEITPNRTTSVAADFFVPLVGNTVDVLVSDASVVSGGYPVFIGGGEYLVMSKAGNVLTLRNNTATPADTVFIGTIVSALDVNDPTKDKVWMKQAEQWHVTQNDRDGAILFNGSSARRAVLTGAMPEVPTGSIMEYSQGRLWVVVAGRRTIAAGDLFYPFKETSVITFGEEVEDVQQSGRFIVPSQMPITGLKLIPAVDTVTGQGPLLVYTQDMVASINVPFYRPTWKTLDYPVVRAVQLNYGAVSNESIVSVNGDHWSRYIDGIRSFKLARADFMAAYGNVPQSTEMDRVLDRDTQDLLEFTSAIHFDNRLLMTFGPQLTPNGVRHRGIVALDFDPLSSIRGKSAPVYEGVWTGIRPTRLVSGFFRNTPRAFAWCLNDDGENELWEIMTETGFDNDEHRIRCAVELRSFDWQRKFIIKELMSIEAWSDEVVGMVDISVYWRPDYAPCWFDWGTKQICAQYQDCEDDPEVCKTVKSFSKGYRTRWGIGTPPNLEEPFDKKPARLGYLHQVRIEWFGQMSLKSVLLKATSKPEYKFPSVD